MIQGTEAADRQERLCYQDLKETYHRVENNQTLPQYLQLNNPVQFYPGYSQQIDKDLHYKH